MSTSAFPYRTLAVAALSTIGASAFATEYSIEAIIDPDGSNVRWPPEPPDTVYRLSFV
ncbi:hypothetical protein [Ideonella sp.]|jgi:hypothetical protein|uniref:hypothetical protein n=1 Tax=Ideonella sp. TaxID=1929293 RepID=UPI0037BEA1C3